MKTVNIVGGGVFGISAAVELKLRALNSGEDVHVQVFDASDILPNPRASSSDYNRIIRADYGNQDLFMNLSFKAIEKWENWNEESGRVLFHPVGWLILTEKEMKEKEFEYESYVRMKEKV